MTQPSTEGISELSATCLTTLFCRAAESRSETPLLRDPEAERIVEGLRPELEGAASAQLRRLATGQVSGPLAVHIALRARRYDRYAQDFLERNPEGVVVNLGCGMDSRFQRIDDGRLELFDLDLPEVITLKRRFLPESDRYHHIASSVLDLAWIERLKAALGRRPVIFLAEGLLMYLEEQEVRRLLTALCEAFPGSEVVCEMFNRLWLSWPLRAIVERKLRKGLQFGASARFRFGIREGRDLEAWHPGITVLDEWSYVDEQEDKLGALALMRHIDLLRRTQWTVRYGLGGAGSEAH